jgi:hypothetical protein
VPTGATTGKIEVTVDGGTATSATDFTVTPRVPNITGFDPLSGRVGTAVTITGSNFDPVPANNTVKFDGVEAVVTASTATTITTTVPSLATTGPITVTVNGETGASAENFHVVFDETPPVVTNLSPTTVNAGETLTLTVELADDESPITSASIEYRSIADERDSNTIPFTLESGSPYHFEFTGAQVGPLGLEYRIFATSEGGTYESPDFLRVTPVYADGLIVPYSSFGAEQTNYRIVAVPLELTANTVGDVFSALAPYDKTQWRMYRYSGGQTSELTPQTHMIPGSGYWLIIRSAGGGQIKTGSGTPVQASFEEAFTINLQAGWNQIGNPYNFNLSWADVQAENPGLPGLRIYNGSFTDSPVLKKMEGGFVKVTAAQELRFPVIRNIAFQSGRSRDDVVRLSNPINGNNWQVYFTLEQGALTNQISGFGMNRKASDGFDALDGFNMPPFFDEVLELQHDKTEGVDTYSSDIVPPSAEHEWDFVIKSTVVDNTINLRWDNSYFGDGGPDLYLWDEALQRAIDMRAENTYGFQKDVSSRFKVFYGSPDYVKERTAVSQLTVHAAWPNPASGKVTVSFSLPESSSGRGVEISIADLMGREALAYRGKFTAGYHEVSFERTPEMRSGIYFFKIADGATARVQRIIFK